MFQELELHGLRYLIRYPDGFDANASYPAIFFLHGAGSRGDNMDNLIAHPFFQDIQKHSDFPFVIVAPLCTENTWFDLWERLMALVKQSAALPYIDENRIYLMGASMGGYGSWQMAMSLPEYFAAMVPICGGGLFWNAARLVNVPVWAFHGGKDTVIPPEESRKMVDAVNAAGGNAKLTIYPDNDHNAWSDTYSNPEVFAWLLQHRNSNAQTLSNPYRNVEKYG